MVRLRGLLLATFIAVVGIVGFTGENNKALAATQAVYVMADANYSVYAKVYGEPNETVYVNFYFMDYHWTTKTVVLDNNGFARVYAGTTQPGTWKARVYYFSNGNEVWSSAYCNRICDPF